MKTQPAEITSIPITLKTLTELLGFNFYVPEYQRGYRWTQQNVLQLLDDIWEYRTKGSPNNFYCLQPVVVKEAEWQDIQGNTVRGYELIDGQQRLTTLHRIITYLMLEHLRTDSLEKDYNKELYEIYYKTRLESREFLKGNTFDRSKPDLYYMSEAYQTIKNWFEDKTRQLTRPDKNKFLDVLLPPHNDVEWSVKLIWYEVADAQPGLQQSSNNIFTRINRGKIPLTSAELIKAIFVNNKSFTDQPIEEQVRRKTEIIQIWDEIEINLHDPGFWSFITNKIPRDYSNRIELMFELITKKGDRHVDPLYSFIHFFSADETSDSLWQKWVEVEELYKTLKYWYSDKNYYHKVGYLIASGINVKQLIEKMGSCRKAEFDQLLNRCIAETIPENWDELNYQNASERQQINNLLLLHNLEIIRENDNLNEFFPFVWYKDRSKSLEHIHAQNAEEISSTQKEQWVDWLNEHLKVLKGRIDQNEMLKKAVYETEAALPRLTYQLFKSLSQRILAFFNENGESNISFMHRMENLALLGFEENAALSHSAFDVKRRKLIAMDKEGCFMPIATKRIFLKYYADEHEPKHTLWTAKDRDNYLADLQIYFKPYIDLKSQ